MAGYPDLIHVLARMDGRPFPSIDTFARLLRASGFLSETKRGNASTRVTPEDAASLLIALMATDSPTASPRVVDVFRGLVRLPAPAEKNLPRTLALLIKLPSFSEFLAGAIEHAGTLRNELGESGIELQVSRSVPAAALMLRDPMGRRRRIAEWVINVRRYGPNAPTSLPEAENGADRRLIATITQRTIYALGDLLEHAEVDA